MLMLLMKSSWTQFFFPFSFPLPLPLLFVLSSFLPPLFFSSLFFLFFVSSTNIYGACDI